MAFENILLKTSVFALVEDMSQLRNNRTRFARDVLHSGTHGVLQTL
jgi:hypothetical protein